MSFSQPNRDGQSFELSVDNDPTVIARIALLGARQPLRIDALSFDGAANGARLRLRVSGDARTVALLERQLRAVVEVRSLCRTAAASGDPPVGTASGYIVEPPSTW